MDHTLLRCPDCGGLFDSDLVCQGCGRRIESQPPFWDFRPRQMVESKLNEDAVFAPGSPEAEKFAGKPWRKLIGRLEIERFDREVLPVLPVGVFLELAGESCWASAIYKSTHPTAVVFASDVSPNAIQSLAMPLGGMFPHTPDVFAALDAENLPFGDDTIDCVFIEAAMHHMPDPVRMLSEIKRVLRPGGRFVAVDHCIPRHFRFLFSSTAHERSEAYGIQEDLISYARWAEIFRQAGFPAECLHAYTDTSYLRNPYFAIAGRLAAVLPQALSRAALPVGLYVQYDKV